MFQYENKLSKDFNDMIKKIDLNIKDLNLNKSDKILFNETNNLLSTASLILNPIKGFGGEEGNREEFV